LAADAVDAPAAQAIAATAIATMVFLIISNPFAFLGNALSCATRAEGILPRRGAAADYTRVNSESGA
jgi:hypothetical protein